MACRPTTCSATTPELEPADITACIAYAAERVAEVRVYPVGAA